MLLNPLNLNMFTSKKLIAMEIHCYNLNDGLKFQTTKMILNFIREERF
jgi:hypothetical protein